MYIVNPSQFSNSRSTEHRSPLRCSPWRGPAAPWPASPRRVGKSWENPTKPIGYWEIHSTTIGKWWFNGFDGIYPLVKVYETP